MDLSSVGNEDGRRAKRHDPADPRCKRWTELHMVDTRYVATRVVVHRARVDHRFAALMAPLHILGAERCEPGQIAKDPRPTSVQRMLREYVG